jgi:hypothetical protein
MGVTALSNLGLAYKLLRCAAVVHWPLPRMAASAGANSSSSSTCCKL